MSSPSGGKTPRRPIRRKQSAPPEAPAPHPDFVMYTDGSCLRNPDGPGGWAAVITDQHTGEVTELHGGHPSTTNNRMELSAAIAALSFPSHPANIALYTDSQYLKTASRAIGSQAGKSAAGKKQTEPLYSIRISGCSSTRSTAGIRSHSTGSGAMSESISTSAATSWPKAKPCALCGKAEIAARPGLQCHRSNRLWRTPS